MDVCVREDNKTMISTKQLGFRIAGVSGTIDSWSCTSSRSAAVNEIGPFVIGWRTPHICYISSVCYGIVSPVMF